MLKNHFISFIALPLFLVAPLVANPHTPGWVERYLENPTPAWEGWENALLPKGTPTEPVRLARGGETDYVIVHPAEPSVAERRAAQELALWLAAITGAEFALVPDGDPLAAGERTLRVGRVAGSAYAGTEPDFGELDDGRYEIRVEDDTLYFEGPGLNSPLNAVYAFLEEDLGVRWLSGWRGLHPNDPRAPEGWRYVDFFREMGESLREDPELSGVYRLPKDPDLSVAVAPRVSVPAYATRGFTPLYTTNPWGLRNRLNMGPDGRFNQRYYAGGLFVHTFHTLVPPSKYFQSNPEYFSFIDGEWRWERAQINMANPEVVEIAAQTAISRLRNIAPGRRMISVSPMDWTGYSEDPESLRLQEELGGLTGLVLHFASQLTERIVEEIPDATVTVLSYADYNLAPEVDLDLHPNLVIRFCTDWGASFDFPYHSFYDEKLGMPIETNNPARFTAQLPNLERWQELADRFHLWLYPTQYRNNLAPMPNIRAVAENLRFFAEQGFESAFVEQYHHKDQSREAMRFWIWSKLMWDPTLDVETLMRDFIGAYYGEAAPAVWDYHRLLWDHAARYNDYERRRHWVYAIEDEGMFGYGYIEKATAILNRGLASTDDPAIRERVELLQLGVDFVEVSQLLRTLRDGTFEDGREDLQAAQEQFFARAERLGISDLYYFDGVRAEKTTDDLRAAFEVAETRLFDRNFVSADRWTEWGLRLDPEDVGVAKHWYRGEGGTAEDWTPVEVPAFLGQAGGTAPTGYFWYRAAFRLTEAEAAQTARLLFGGVDEQAWVYLNGEYLGEHTLESEFVVGDEVTVSDLWDRPFELAIEPGRLNAGWNALYVRVHNSAYNAGIHSPVDLELIAELLSLSLKEDFEGAPQGSVLAGTELTTGAGGAFGLWRVTQGAVSFDGTPPSPSALNPESPALSLAPGGSTLRFDLKQPIMGGLDLSFRLRQLDALANMNVVRVRLIDAEGRNIALGMSTIGPHYGPGGQSGFAIFDAEGDAGIGPKGVHLRTDTEAQAIRLTFDPRDGLAFYYDGSDAPTVRIPGVPGLGPIEAIELLASQQATWVVEDLAIESL